CSRFHVCCSGLQCRPISPLSPYTTLFRSAPGRQRLRGGADDIAAGGAAELLDGGADHRIGGALHSAVPRPCAQFWRMGLHHRQRSEEHTSELQSRENLVCRLLLEKKMTYE